ncbi:hypothetical protein [Bacteriovorax sp. Seq25_V]|uniref:hypothetical protein n=1 Tax=Bacteriovorax sp. Seq25_V TaxID=1201288 RepID=UPI0004060AFD|nr:hypothetical protein [Bacteriovorax sp. Seq25_V]
MKFLVILTILFSHASFANEACSRIAIINQQEVLVDPSSNRKGEGLRYHLEKDEIAKRYLDEYQNTIESNLRPAIIGTAGTGLILSAFVANASDKNRKVLLFSGVATILINFLIDKTIDSSNEKNFTQAIEEYNKRQFPKIYLKDNENVNPSQGIMMEKSWSF